MTNKDAEELLRKFEQGLCTEDEIALLESWYVAFNEESNLIISDDELVSAESRMMQALNLPMHKIIPMWSKIAVAASLVIVCACSYYFFSLSNHNNNAVSAKVQHIGPGGNNAVLILEGGDRIDLEQSASGRLAQDAGIAIVKRESGKLEYDAGAGSVNQKGKAGFNTILTPRGGTYQVVLSDGSKVWLNSESSIKFPTCFIGTERHVELQGEAYFEVAKDASKPFIVKVDKQSVRVLGTTFNVNSYINEKVITTTLVEGAVKVSNNTNHLVLKAGQQAIAAADNKFLLKTVDVNEFLAWRNGMFSFNKANLETVMRQFERWYDIEVEFEANAPEISFTGKIYRNLNLNEALNNLSFLGVKFKTIDRRVTVLAK